MAITKDTTTLPGQTIVTDSNGGIAIDYSSYYERIATALETIATDTTAIKTSLANVDTQLTTMSTSISTMTTNSTTITGLATGTGIHMVGPYDWLGYMSLYKLYVEDTGAIGLTKLTEYKDKVKALPTLF